jgi:hypothetical protein
MTVAKMPRDYVPVDALWEKTPPQPSAYDLRCSWCDGAYALNSRRGLFWCGLFCLLAEKCTAYVQPHPARVDRMTPQAWRPVGMPRFHQFDAPPWMVGRVRMVTRRDDVALGRNQGQLSAPPVSSGRNL